MSPKIFCEILYDSIFNKNRKNEQTFTFDVYKEKKSINSGLFFRAIKHCSSLIYLTAVAADSTRPCYRRSGCSWSWRSGHRALWCFSAATCTSISSHVPMHARFIRWSYRSDIKRRPWRCLVTDRRWQSRSARFSSYGCPSK